VGGEAFDNYRTQFLAELGVLDPRRHQPLPLLGDDGPVGSGSGTWG